MFDSNTFKSIYNGASETISKISKSIQDNQYVKSGSNWLSKMTSKPSVLVSNNNGTPTQEKTPEILSKEDVDNIIGLPPQAYISSSSNFNAVSKRVLQSMLIMNIYPAYPKFAGIVSQTGLNLYKVDISKGKEMYEKALTGTGISPITPVRIAVINDSQVSESWTNDFGESNFEDAVNSAGDALRDIKFMSGNDFGDIAAQIGKSFSDVIGDTNNNLVQNSGQKLGNVINSGITKSKNFADNLISGSGAGAISVLTGGKIDFPQVWRSASYSPSYSFNIRLYNPFPDDFSSYNKYIITPIGRVLGLICPLSDSNFSMSFPVICKVKCPGLFDLDAGYVSNIEIIKGGQNNDISFWQRPGQVDIRITFGSLYSTMMARCEENVNEDRPTLDRYIRNLKGYTIPPQINDNDNPRKTGTNGVIISDIDSIVKNAQNTSQQSNIINNIEQPLTYFRNTLSRNEISSDLLFQNPLFESTIDGDKIDDLSIFKQINEEILSFDTSLRKITNIDFGLNMFGTIPRNLKIEDKIAFRIKYKQKYNKDSKVTPYMENWYWNNHSTFDSATRSITHGLTPPKIGANNINTSININTNLNFSESNVL